jgi:hypothetical protein
MPCLALCSPITSCPSCHAPLSTGLPVPDYFPVVILTSLRSVCNHFIIHNIMSSGATPLPSCTILLSPLVESSCHLLPCLFAILSHLLPCHPLISCIKLSSCHSLTVSYHPVTPCTLSYNVTPCTLSYQSCHSLHSELSSCHFLRPKLSSFHLLL